jgi:uncharacterized protein (TIGR03435 family)
VPAVQRAAPLQGRRSIGPTTAAVSHETLSANAFNALLTMWSCGVVAIALSRLRTWQRIRRAVRASTAMAVRGIRLPPGVQVRTAPGVLEPGVLGLRRAIVLLPAGIERWLTPSQLEAVLDHELCHVRRRDNVTAAIQMVAEALFWFHPLVWWIGARLVEERERACDEEVTRLGSPPRVYAESILRVCAFAVESPLACVPGVTGSDLAKRIDAIMASQVGEAVSRGQQMVLGAATMLVIAIPVGLGVLIGPRISAQQPAAAASGPAFEVASIKPNAAGSAAPTRSQVLPGGRYVATNMQIRLLIGQAYRVSSLRLIGGPGWITSEHFDINAKAEGELFAHGNERPLDAALRALLADRFKLRVHFETRQLPIYALILARSDGRVGPNLTPSARADCETLVAALQGRGDGPPPPPPSGSGDAPPCGARSAPGTVWADSQMLSFLAGVIAGEVNRTVDNRTGLTGRYNFRLTWTPDPMPQRSPDGPDDLPPIDPNGPSIFTAVQEQLGLKLESTTGPVDVLVIDQVERPTRN